MIDEFKIYIDRLQTGDTQHIEGAFAPDLLEIDEAELQFHHPVSVKAEAYTTDDDLIVRFSASTAATMPCAICNELIQVPVSCTDDYVAEPLEEIKGAIYNFGFALREGLLTQLPPTAECNEGHCPARKALEQYFRKDEEEPQISPFKDIDLEQ